LKSRNEQLEKELNESITKIDNFQKQAVISQEEKGLIEQKLLG